MLQVDIKITGSAEEMRRLNDLGDKLHDFSGAMRTIGTSLTQYYSGQAFASQGGVFGIKWPDLNPVYARRKAVGNTKRPPIGKGAYPGTPILYATGAMQEGFEHTSDTSSVVISNSAPYFKYHQSTDQRTKMPYRPMMLINDDVKSIVRDVIESDIQSKLENA